MDLNSDMAALLRGRGVQLGALPSVLASRYGTRTAVIDDAATPGLHPGGARGHIDLEEATARLAAAHAEHGRGETDRVLVVVDNRIDLALHAFALARIGAVPVPVNPHLKAQELAAVVDATGATAAVVDDHLDDRLPPDTGVTVSRTGEDGLGGWVAQHPDARVAARDRDPEAAALMLTTSGTTGTPKAAVLTSRGLLNALGRLVAAPVGGRIRGDRDRVLAALPLTHVMGFSVLLGCLCAGVPLRLRPRFDAADTLRLIEQDQPNVFVGVPTMYADLEAAGAAEHDLSSLQLWISAADAMPTDRARRFQRYGAAVRPAGRPVGTAAFLDIYGMVELSGAAAVRLFPPSMLPGVAVPAISMVLPGIDVRAVDDHGEPVGWGRKGELQFKGPGVLEGYEGHADVGPDAAGWFATGDYGRIWPGGVFAFAGRKRDRLKVGGFSVFPAEVEEELHDAPGVGEVAVVGVEDERLGERPVALVVPAAPDFDRETFLRWAEERVAGYRRPSEVLVVDDLPRGNHGKIDRAAATETARALLEHDTASTPSPLDG